jgi:flagellar protein FliS
MSNSTRQAYIVNELQHAPPQRLRLALIHGAIQYAGRARDAWLRAQSEDGFEAMSHCREIIVELLAGIRPDGSELVEKVQALYEFLLRAAVAAQRDRSAEVVGEIIEVLEEERTTWQMVCEQLPEALVVPPSHLPKEVLAPIGESILPKNYGRHSIPALPVRGEHSFEA